MKNSDLDKKDINTSKKMSMVKKILIGAAIAGGLVLLHATLLDPCNSVCGSGKRWVVGGPSGGCISCN
jgi:predicted small secreted protein